MCDASNKRPNDYINIAITPAYRQFNDILNNLSLFSCSHERTHDFPPFDAFIIFINKSTKINTEKKNNDEFPSMGRDKELPPGVVDIVVCVTKLNMR